jgi:hypothetical protein
LPSATESLDGWRLAEGKPINKALLLVVQDHASLVYSAASLKILGCLVILVLLDSAQMVKRSTMRYTSVVQKKPLKSQSDVALNDDYRRNPNSKK